jgi:hypothetical protein
MLDSSVFHVYGTHADKGCAGGAEYPYVYSVVEELGPTGVLAVLYGSIGRRIYTYTVNIYMSV